MNVFSPTLLYHSFCKVSQYVNLSTFQEEKGCWLWKKPPPQSKKPMNIVDPFDPTKIQIVRPKAIKPSFKIKDRLLKGIWSLVITINFISFSLDHCYLKVFLLSTHYSNRLVNSVLPLVNCFCRVWLQYLSQGVGFPSYYTLCSQLLQRLLGGCLFWPKLYQEQGDSKWTQFADAEEHYEMSYLCN
jgi:hypothetical protein